MMGGTGEWHAFLSPVLLSAKVALLSSVFATVIGVAVARWMSRHTFKGKTVLETGLMLPLVLPPSIVGFLLLIVLGRRSWIGRLIEWLFSAPIIFSWWAAVVASTVVAFPLVYQTMKVGFSAIDKTLEEAGRSEGASDWEVFRYIAFPLAYPSLISAYILGFARGFGEFGATLMIAGNIPGKTQTIPTAIYVAVDSGNLRLAWSWAISMVCLSFVMLLLTGRRNSGG